MGREVLANSQLSYAVMAYRVWSAWPRRRNASYWSSWLPLCLKRRPRSMQLRSVRRTRALDVSQWPFSVDQPWTSMTLTIRNVVLHACLLINFELAGVDRTTKAWVKLPSVLPFGIALRVVNVLGRKIAAKAFFGDLELGGSVSVSCMSVARSTWRTTYRGSREP